MKKSSRLAGSIVLVFAFCGIAVRSNSRPATQSSADKDRIERGRYLVEQVAICSDCHTPHTEKGQPIADQALQGASTVFKPLQPAPTGPSTPPLVGFPGISDDQAITFLTIGKDPSGQLAAPPMPQYRLTREDATAVLVLPEIPRPGRKNKGPTRGAPSLQWRSVPRQSALPHQHSDRPTRFWVARFVWRLSYIACRIYLR